MKEKKEKGGNIIEESERKRETKSEITEETEGKQEERNMKCARIP